MANKKFFVGILAVMLVLGMAIVGCDDGSDGSGGNSSAETFPTAKGKITINGLSSFNGKYVYGTGLAGAKALVGVTDITGYGSVDAAYKLVKISNGKAEVPLYYVNTGATSYANPYVAYDGNDSVSATSPFSLIILDDADGVLKLSEAVSVIASPLGAKNITSGTFSNGNLTVTW
jgi:hypothetical protein